VTHGHSRASDQDRLSRWSRGRSCYRSSKLVMREFDSLRPLSLSLTRSGIQAHVLDADDLLTFVHGDCVPDRHVVSGKCSS
jgi:hypothetical protein